MQNNTIFPYIVGGMYALIFWLFIYQIEIRWHPYAKIKCKFGFHKRTTKKSGKITNKYRCVHCNSSKSHPHLRIIDGGKKDIGIKFRF